MDEALIKSKLILRQNLPVPEPPAPSQQAGSGAAGGGLLRSPPARPHYGKPPPKACFQRCLFLCVDGVSAVFQHHVLHRSAQLFLMRCRRPHSNNRKNQKPRPYCETTKCAKFHAHSFAIHSRGGALLHPRGLAAAQGFAGQAMLNHTMKLQDSGIFFMQALPFARRGLHRRPANGAVGYFRVC